MPRKEKFSCVFLRTKKLGQHIFPGPAKHDGDKYKWLFLFICFTVAFLLLQQHAKRYKRKYFNSFELEYFHAQTLSGEERFRQECFVLPHIFIVSFFGVVSFYFGGIQNGQKFICFNLIKCKFSKNILYAIRL